MTKNKLLLRSAKYWKILETIIFQSNCNGQWWTAWRAEFRIFRISTKQNVNKWTNLKNKLSLPNQSCILCVVISLLAHHIVAGVGVGELFDVVKVISCRLAKILSTFCASVPLQRCLCLHRWQTKSRNSDNFKNYVELNLFRIQTIAEQMKKSSFHSQNEIVSIVVSGMYCFCHFVMMKMITTLADMIFEWFSMQIAWGYVALDCLYIFILVCTITFW